MKKDFLPRWPWPQTETSPDFTLDARAAEAHNYLIESLNIQLAYPNLSPDQNDQLEAIVAADACHLAAQLVPLEVAEELDLERLPESSEPAQPSISDAYLLAKAFDLTHNQTVHDALGYILEYEPPHSSDALKEAYDRSDVSGDPVMLEVNRIWAAEVAKAEGESKS